MVDELPADVFSPPTSSAVVQKSLPPKLGRQAETPDIGVPDASVSLMTKNWPEETPAIAAPM